MTATARGHVYRAALGIQAAEGTAQTTNNALWESSLYDGSTVQSEQDVQEYVVTDTDDLPSGYYTTQEWASAIIDQFVEPTAVMVPWHLHLGTEASTLIAGADYKHTITKADLPLFGTAHFMRPDVIGGTNKWSQMVDGFCKTIELSGSAGNPIRQKSTWLGKKEIFDTTAPTPTATPALGLAGDYTLRTAGQGKAASMIGATLLLDLDATPAATAIHTIESFVITSDFPNFKFVQTDLLNPSYWDKGSYAVGVSLSVLFDSFNAYRSTFYGTKTASANMAQSAAIVYGALDFLFPVTDGTANRSLGIQLPSLTYVMAPPVVTANGDAVRVTMTAKIQKAASGESISVLARNARVAATTSGA